MEATCLWDTDRRTALRAFVAYNLAMGSVAPIENTFTLFLTPMANTLEAGEPNTNVAFSVTLVVYALASPYLTGIADRRGVRTSLVIAFIAVTVSSINIASTHSLMQLYAGYFVAGLAIAAIYTPCVVAGMQVMPARLHSVATGITCVNYLLLPTLIAAPIRWMIGAFHWRVAMMTQGIISMMVLFISYLLCPRTEASPPNSNGGELLADEHPVESKTGFWPNDVNLKDFLLFFVISCTISLVYFSAIAEPQAIFEAELPKDSIGILIGTSTNLVANTVSRLAWGVLATRCAARLVLAMAFLLATTCLLVWAWFTKYTVVSLIASAGVTLGTAAQWTLLPVIVAQTFGPERATFVYAWSQTSQLIAAILGAPGISAVAQASSWSKALFILACVSAFSVVLLLVLGDGRKTNDQQESMSQPSDGVRIDETRVEHVQEIQMSGKA